MNEQHFDALPPVNVAQTPLNEAGNVSGEANTSRQTERQPAPQGDQASSGFVDPSTVMPPPLPLAANDPPDDQTVQDDSSTPPIADDVDLIEKEWVEKAKQIVEKTKHDPYLQNEEMTKMKADYLKKRYNRDIKASKA